MDYFEHMRFREATPSQSGTRRRAEYPERISSSIPLPPEMRARYSYQITSLRQLAIEHCHNSGIAAREISRRSAPASSSRAQAAATARLVRGASNSRARLGRAATSAGMRVAPPLPEAGLAGEEAEGGMGWDGMGPAAARRGRVARPSPRTSRTRAPPSAPHPRRPPANPRSSPRTAFSSLRGEERPPSPQSRNRQNAMFGSYFTQSLHV
jgi:hypothetical protein